ncbi:cyclin-L1-1 isoform X3 [Physcomitrium patens]|uniref:Cyclin-L1-1 n=1 Tax=Physcomitrium patens TaxID=3218 RepID=A0A2K1K4N4_PHYPA|nr:cyclin-L1-1-like isoform X1 [Physcomitrium patens]XP_024385276.1 cyclin-L1-1-like isoform X1 [Physcomitrium patens]PNR48737.1 hypothetical protein PHYPA_013214 [Physcomitrium patens]|eukprot:XP_024385274.1 cyclin-L1-1-like isoform X1 [Physcomitrella patens]
MVTVLLFPSQLVFPLRFLSFSFLGFLTSSRCTWRSLSSSTCCFEAGLVAVEFAPGFLSAVVQMIYTALDTFYVTDEQLSNSPSRKDGIDDKTESILRRFGCDLVQESGILLKLPQAVMATGQVLFHRFYCKKSFARFNVKRVAASCVWLAAKLEESPRKIHEVLQVFNRMEQRRGNLPLEFLELSSQKYEEMKTDLIRTERHLLKEMGFICHVEHPHKFIISYLKVLAAPSELMQVAWNLANDSLRSTLCVRFKSEVVACGVVYAAARKFKVPLPDRWWEVFDAEWSDVQVVCKVLAELYKQPKGYYIEVGRDPKSFVLTSKSWDISTEAQEGLIRTMVNGAVSVEQVPTIVSSDAGAQKGPAFKTPVDNLKPEIVKDRSHDLDEVRNPNANGDSRDDPGVGKEKPFNHIEDEGRDKSRDKDRSRSRLRESRDIARDHDAERERARVRDRDRERRDKERERDERESTKGRGYSRKERGRDIGHAQKIRYNADPRERDFQLVREKDRSQLHRRQNI